MTTGKHEWEVQGEEQDYAADILRSQYGDMVHDDERNEKYDAAIRTALSDHPGLSVLDIGTGTGLLSLMAARAGAKKVTALEVFKPMAAIAQEIVKDNGMQKEITIIPKRSTDVAVRVDVAETFDMVISELVDTQLIGEGCIPTYRHAIQALLRPGAIMIPYSASIFVQVVESDVFRNWHNISESADCLADGMSCCGSSILHDVQIDRLQRHIRCLTEPVEILTFDFTNEVEPDSEARNRHVELKSIAAGRCDAIVMWWRLNLYKDIFITTAPEWVRGSSLPWRDHWMQAVQLLPGQTVTDGQSVYLSASFDDYSVWFNASLSMDTLRFDQTSCTCGSHVIVNVDRIWMLNDHTRTRSYRHALQTLVTGKEDVTCFACSDGGFLANIAGTLPEISHVWTHDADPFSRRFTRNFLTKSGRLSRVSVVEKDVEELLSSDFGEKGIDLFIGEPYFSNNMLPWHSLYFWYVRSYMEKLLSPLVTISPISAVLRGIFVEFKHFHTCFSPVGMVCGFDLSAYDRKVQQGIATEASIHLWEYEHRRCSEPFDILSFDFTELVCDRRGDVNVAATANGKCNALVMWMSFQIAPEVWLEQIPSDAPIYGKQAVHILPSPSKIEIGMLIKVSANFTMEHGDVDIKCTMP